MAFLCNTPTPPNLSSCTAHFTSILQVCHYLCLSITNIPIIFTWKIISKPFSYLYSHLPLIHPLCTKAKVLFLIYKSYPISALFKYFLGSPLPLELPNIQDPSKIWPISFSFLRNNLLLHSYSYYNILSSFLVFS